MCITDKVINININKYLLKIDNDQAKAVSDFNRRVLTKEIPFEEVPCLCGNDKFSLVADKDRHGLIQSTVICKKCGLIQSNPRMIDEYYRFFYESDEYRRLYDGNYFIDKYESLYNKSADDLIYKRIIDYKDIKELKSVLEFGAGGGWNLFPFVRKGIFVKGYELSKNLVQKGKNKGINLVYGDINDVEGTYDVIILNHVIEHFTHFINHIKKIKAFLNHNGIIYVAVPDIEQFHIGHLQNAHTYYFTHKTLQYYMGLCGLRMVTHQQEIGSHMSAIFVVEASNLDETFLKDHYQEMVRVLKRKSRVYNPFRRLIVSTLALLGVKNTVKRMLNR